MMQRVIMVWFKEEARENIAALTADYRALPEKYNGLLNVIVGRPTEGDNDLVIEMRFRDGMAMRLCESSADYKALYARLTEAARRIESNVYGDDQRMGQCSSVRSADDYPLKWHHFLIYFSLWANAILNLFNALQLGTGGIYGGSEYAAAVYAAYPAMRFADTGAAIFLFILAVLAVLTRFSLARFQRRGPLMLLWTYAMNITFSVVYAVAASLASGIWLLQLIDGATWSFLIMAVVMIAANTVYYRKRAELFVN